MFVVILTGCIFIHPIAFFILFFAINILGLLEFSHMAKRMHIFINIPVYVLCGSMLFTAGFLHAYWGYRDGYLWCFITSFMLGIWELYRKKGNAFQNIAFAYYGLLYLSLPFTLLIYLPYMTTGAWKPEIIFFPFLLVWLNDTICLPVRFPVRTPQTLSPHIPQEILGRCRWRRCCHHLGCPSHSSLH